MSEQTYVDLSRLEYKAGREYLPITLPRQYGFVNVAQVKEYVKQHGKDEGSRDENPEKLMSLLMEVFFGHYSTCRLNHTELIAMWRKLMSGWVGTLYDQNEWLVPEEVRRNSRGYIDFDDYVMDAEIRINSTSKNKKVELNALHKRYRTKSDLVLLVSKYSFIHASRFYILPLHLRPEIVKQYSALRDGIIEAWYDMVMDFPKVMRRINPNTWFSSLEPKTVATRIFRPDLYIHTDMLNKKKNAFNRWWARERKISLESAETTNDPAFVATRTREWEEAKVYATSLYNALLPRSRALDAEDDAFIDNAEYSDDENMHQELDNQRMEEDVREAVGSLKHVGLIDEDAAMASGDYDNYVKRQLKKADRRTAEFEKKFKGLIDEADEKGDDEEASDEGESEAEGDTSAMSDDDMDGGNYLERMDDRL